MYVQKADLESGLASPLGGARLSGIEFEVTNESANPVVVGGKTYGKGEAVATLTTDEKGYAATAGDALPYGTYAMRETRTNGSYLLSDGNEFTFSVREDGKVVNGTGTDDGTAKDRVRRSDLQLKKRDGLTADRLACVPFRITSRTTGESHVAVTDANGVIDTSSGWNAHSANTNANDWALDAEGAVDSSKLDPEAGVWFGLATDGSTVPANDGYGALPYDTYEIQELRCIANEGYQLVSTSVVITREAKVYDIGTLDDNAPTLATHATDKADGDQVLGVDDCTVADRVDYAGVIPGRDYVVRGELHYADTGEAVTGEDGKAATAEKALSPRESAGHVTLEFPVATWGMGGRTLVVYEYLLDADGSAVASHEDRDDTDQQVAVAKPEIGTTLTDAADGDKTVVADPEASVTDTVSYRNLVPGREYTLAGTLMDKTTGEALRGSDGNPVTAETRFTPETADGEAEVAFEFDSSALDAGTELVAYETLTLKGHEVASHADIDDAGQTVTVKRPEVGTTLTDAADGDHYAAPDGKITLTDTVTYTGLVPGKEYTLTGTLMDKATGEALKDADGNPVTAETKFTPDAADGEAEVAFGLDATDLAGTTVVAFETLRRGDAEVASHADIDDEGQTARVCGIGTELTADGGGHEAEATRSLRLTDTVTYRGLVPGRVYTLTGTLHARDANGTDAGALKGADGSPVTASAEFTAEAADGEAEVVFEVDTSGLGGTTVVAFENLSEDGAVIATHADITDDAQSVTIKALQAPQRAAMPQTGTGAGAVLAVLAGAAVVGAAAAHAARRRRGGEAR